MELTLQQRLDKLLDAYSHHYDIDRDVVIGENTFPATATYYLRDENYLISRQHVLSTVESHEYVYFFLCDHLDVPTLCKQIELTKQLGLANITPSKIHMCSYVTLVVLADTIDPEAKRLVKRIRYRKNYLLTLHGWMEYHLAAMECSTNSFFSNPAGKEARKNLERNFTPRTKAKKGAK
ncbi:MAG: hypothetical protein ACI3V5_05605 [Faecousia sp.]